MNEAKEKDLRLLKELCSETKAIFDDQFLGLITLIPSQFQRVDEWPETWCNYWAFPLSPAFADALDLKLRSSKKFALDENGKKIKVLDEHGNPLLDAEGKQVFRTIITRKYGQGNNFNFSYPCIIWNDVMGYSGVWHPHPNLIGLSVIKSRPVVSTPAFSITLKKEDNIKNIIAEYDSQGKICHFVRKGEIPPGMKTKASSDLIRVITPRDPGLVEVLVYRYNEGKMRPAETFKTTQDDFVRFLIAGEHA